MFEKEAEEYRESKRHKSFREDVGNIQIDYNAYLNNLANAFKDGAEFGYNKANEWHFVKDGDLPKDEKDVLVYSGEDWRMCVGRYSPKYKVWEAGCDTIAWMEIPEPPENGGFFS